MPIDDNHQKLAVTLFNNVYSSIDEQSIRRWPFSTKAIKTSSTPWIRELSLCKLNTSLSWVVAA